MQYKDLWDRFREGDASSFEQLYRQSADKLLGYGYRLTPDRQLVEDCLQELFVEIWEKRERLSDVQSVISYLSVSLRRKIIRAKGQNLKKVGSDEAEDHHFEAEIAIDQQIIDQETDMERSQDLQKAMNELSGRQREALYLKYQLGMDYEEICEHLDMNYQSARNLISRGLAKLKKYLLCLLPLFFHFPL